MALDQNLFSFIFHHVFFPPQLPQEAEEELARLENQMIATIVDVMQDFILNLAPESQRRWDGAFEMLHSWNNLHTADGIVERSLKSHLYSLGSFGAIACHIRAQNCGWVAFHDEDQDMVIVDAFEVSATDESVLSSNGLLRRFPGVSVAIPANKLADERFCSSIASSVAQLASEAVTDMLPKSRKAGTDMVEVRDTTHPGLVTEGLMTQLLAVGCQNKSTKVVKCVRDEVNWHSALLPWRRSPAWLVFRVALQIILQRCFPDSEGHIQYKNFVLFLMAMLADLITKKNQQETSNQNIERWAIIRARLGQRIFKLKKDVFPFVANRVNSTDKYLLDKTLSAQEEIREANRVVIPHVPSSASQEELHMSLVHCKSYLHAAMNPSHVEVKPTVFDPPHFPSLQLDDGLPVLSCVSVTAVCAFEEWIDHNLQAWYTNLATSIYEKICGRVEILMKQYWLFAQQIYDSNPPVISVAVLVMLELWVVLDRMAVHICPLLKEYSPEIPKNFLQPLLLPKFSQMKRARKIEQYLSARYDESESSYPSIFCDPAPYCFGVQYFDSSLEHQILERNIQTHAEKARVAKRMEWERLSALHENLCDEMRRSSHLWDYDSRGQYVHFNYRCRLCSLEREAESMRIQLHEWPLPDKDIARKCAVFELNLPIWFAPWRNMTWYTVQELGQRRTTGANGLEKAWLNYAGVAEFAVDRNSDIILSSDKKSWSQTHYNGHGFPVSFETICVRNGLHLRLFDNIKNAWVMEQTEKPSVKAMCTMKLPPGRYSSLQFAISSTTHTQNEVMAAQKHCHRNLSLREFESFGCLRSGENIQWYNILRELASAALSFNEEAVGSLIRQAAWEMGRAISDFDSTERAANVAFKDIEFAGRLLQMLKERLTQIEKNWHEHRTLDIIVALVCRIAALSSEPCLIEKVFNFLRQCRNVAMDWCNDLNENVVDHEEGPKFRQNVILQIASTCQATFDVDASQVTASLSSSEDLCSFIRCSIFLFENRPSAISRLPDNIRFKVENSERTRFLFRVHTRKMIMEHPLGLSEALQRTISCLEVSGAWKICEEADSWVTSRTEGRLNAVSQQLHYNYLTGEFLVDGNTPGRLPANYMSHPLYQRLFGVRPIPVIPSNLPGSSFVSSNTIEGFEVHFGMQGHKFLIKTRKGSGILQLIPQDVIVKDFPKCFVTENFHWLNLETGTLEFRPANDRWRVCRHNWQLSFDPLAPDKMRMQQDSTFLVDIRCPTFKRLDRILKVLDTTEHIVVVKKASGIIEAEQSRLRVKFSVNDDGKLVSKEFNALVDSNQDVGCLYGLENKLVLVDSSNQRSVLIPYGKPIVTKTRDHVAVSISRSVKNHLKYMHYVLDTHLGILRGSHLLAILYQAYLHAVTSFPLPDYLTHRTGTEEAIRILSQGILRSTFPPQNETVEMLKMIAALTPRRTFYPPHLLGMQSVSWSSSLSQLTHHEDFQLLSQEILSYSDQVSHFHGSEPGQDHITYLGSMDLLRRARWRTKQMRNSESSLPYELPTQNVYESRDCDITSARTSRVYEIAALIQDWPSTVHHSFNLVGELRKFSSFSMISHDLAHCSYSARLALSVEMSWVALYNFCKSSFRSTDTYALTMLFSTIAFGGNIDQSILRQLLFIAFSGKCNAIKVPSNGVVSLDFLKGEHFVLSEVESVIMRSYDDFVCPSGESLTYLEHTEKIERAKSHWKEQRKHDVHFCGSHIRAQWPCKAPSLPSSHLIPRVQRGAASQGCWRLCTDWIQNGEFLDFLRQVHHLAPASQYMETPSRTIPNLSIDCGEIENCSFQPPRLLELIHKSHPSCPQFKFLPMNYRGPSTVLRPSSELLALGEYFKAGFTECQRDYGEQLNQSIQALDAISSSATQTEQSILCPSSDWSVNQNAVIGQQKRLFQQRDTLWGSILVALRASDDEFPSISDTVCPSITVWSILAVLASREWATISTSWKKLLVAFGRSISELRRCERLLSYINERDVDGFLKEAENPGYDGWDPLFHPTWLLLEIENNITIRRRQVEVATRMMKPDENKNSLFQLNMGEGKTSVITAMVAAELGNGISLLRIIVLKPLLRQSDALLSQRLGGLINRHIYHIPFSRQTNLSPDTIIQLRSIYEQCCGNRGILLALPEQILSFRLIGLDAAERSPEIFPQLIQLENWLQSRCRDIIDESDEVLDTKFQLVYTMGTQQPHDGSNNRWEIIQHLLRLAEMQAKRLHQNDPKSIEVDQSRYRYPILRFLKSDAIERLIHYLLEAIVDNGIPGLPFNQWTTRVRNSVLRFISNPVLSKDDETIVREEFDGSIFITKLLVLRGLLAFQILRFSLCGKRWLVEYGLHPSRCLMAVPYRAKGIPSENAEFGHPDVAVTLTCLSYYYEGLSRGQLRNCFGLLAKITDPFTVFQDWVAHCIHDLPSGLQAYSGVNLDDEKTFKEVLFPLLRFQKGVIDFYLSNFVFPREAKEFPRKLASSAWDIPARRDLQLTTGFSGTDDNRFLLPLSIHQRDVPDLLHTNAMVIEYLLRDDNRQCILAQDDEGRQLDFDQLLKLVVAMNGTLPERQPVRVLIDVGAQILEAGNQLVAEQWLSITPSPEVEAAVFFGESDEIMIVDRTGHVEPLVSSSFRQRMGACLVFLDQHHSRGVDLKLPPKTRAAVTLGPRLTKDKLVQACNRLRGLDKHQSLLFLIPPEVSHNMRSLLGVSSNRALTSADVLKWTMTQTCQILDSLRPLWANQGLQYHRRIRLWDSIIGQSAPCKTTATSMQESEAQTLEQLYSPWYDAGFASDSGRSGEWAMGDENVRELLKTLQSATGHTGSALLHEEQEREIACEVEKESQVSRPPIYKPCQHQVHEDICHFVRSGKFPGNSPSKSVTLAFWGLKHSSVGKTEYPDALGPRLYATLDFDRTVLISPGDLTDDFCKPVNWVLSGVHSDDLIIVSQYEANHILPMVRQSENSRLSIYAPRITKPMRSFKDLDFFGVGAITPTPAELMTQYLELFSGSLYFESFEDYKNFRYLLGLLTDDLGDIPESDMTNDGFVKPSARLRLSWPLISPFAVSPLPFLSALVQMRTKGSAFQQSHMGSIIQATPLTAGRF